VPTTIPAAARGFLLLRMRVRSGCPSWLFWMCSSRCHVAVL
jgi:hypothetical protein